MARIGIGLIGIGKHGSRYVRHIREDLPDVRLVAIARRDVELARRQAEEFGCRAYADYRELIAAPDIDAVVVVVPPTMHPEIIAATVAARRPVLVEKPAAVSVEAGQRMLRAVRAADIPVMVAQTLRYNEVVCALIEARARIGRIHSLRLGQHFEPSRPGWIDDPAIAGRGMILHTGVHCFDLVRVLSGMEADRVSCEMSSVSTVRTEDNFSVTMRLGGGAALASVAGSRATASRSGGIELAGEHGQLMGDHILHTAHIVQGTTATPLSLPPPAATVRDVLQDFVAALQRGGPMPVPLEEGLRAVAIVEACYHAAHTGQAVPITPI